MQRRHAEKAKAFTKSKAAGESAGSGKDVGKGSQHRVGSRSSIVGRVREAIFAGSGKTGGFRSFIVESRVGKSMFGRAGQGLAGSSLESRRQLRISEPETAFLGRYRRNGFRSLFWPIDGRKVKE